MNKHTKRVATLAASGAVAVLASGIAYAYWTTSGTGTGSAGSGTNASDAKLVITETTSPAGLVPGATAQPVKVKVNNIASYSQVVGEISETVTSYSPAACGAANWTITHVTNTGVALAANTLSDEVTVATVKLNDLGSTVNQDACKNATVNFSFAG